MRETIGEEAERLAHLFGVLEEAEFGVRHRQDGSWIPLSVKEFTDQCGLSVANWLEQHPRVPERYTRIRTVEFRKMRGWLLGGARRALDEVYGFGAAG